MQVGRVYLNVNGGCLILRTILQEYVDHESQKNQKWLKFNVTIGKKLAEVRIISKIESV